MAQISKINYQLCTSHTHNVIEKNFFYAIGNLKKNYNFKKQQKKNTVNFTFLREKKKTVFLIQKKHLACDS